MLRRGKLAKKNRFCVSSLLQLFEYQLHVMNSTSYVKSEAINGNASVPTISAAAAAATQSDAAAAITNITHHLKNNNYAAAIQLL